MEFKLLIPYHFLINNTRIYYLVEIKINFPDNSITRLISPQMVDVVDNGLI